MIVDDFKLRDGRLHLSIFFRSHDFAGAYPANLYGLARLLEYVSGEVGAEPGSISTTSASAHIYEHDWDWVEEMLLGTGRRRLSLWDLSISYVAVNAEPCRYRNAIGPSPRASTAKNICYYRYSRFVYGR